MTLYRFVFSKSTNLASQIYISCIRFLLWRLIFTMIFQLIANDISVGSLFAFGIRGDRLFVVLGQNRWFRLTPMISWYRWVLRIEMIQRSGRC